MACVTFLFRQIRYPYFIRLSKAQWITKTSVYINVSMTGWWIVDVRIVVKKHILLLKIHMEQNDHQIRYDRYVTQDYLTLNAHVASRVTIGNALKFVHVIYNFDMLEQKYHGAVFLRPNFPAFCPILHALSAIVRWVSILNYWILSLWLLNLVYCSWSEIKCVYTHTLVWY